MSNWQLVRSEFTLDQQLSYFEIEITELTAANAVCVGIDDGAGDLSMQLGHHAGAIGYCSDGTLFSNGVSTPYGGGFSQGDTVSIMKDTATGNVWFRV